MMSPRSRGSFAIALPSGFQAAGCFGRSLELIPDSSSPSFDWNKKALVSVWSHR
jgi:hypothetical protein